MAKENERTLTVEERLYADETRPDRVSHLEIADPRTCPACEGKDCTVVCPSKTYRWAEDEGRITVSFENCLECGTCDVICDKKAVDWTYPRGGYGVFYRLS